MLGVVHAYTRNTYAYQGVHEVVCVNMYDVHCNLEGSWLGSRAKKYERKTHKCLIQLRGKERCGLPVTCRAKQFPLKPSPVRQNSPSVSRRS